MSNEISETYLAPPEVTVSISRDLDRTKDILGRWFASRIVDADAVRVIALDKPGHAGGSSETYFTTLEIDRPSGRTTEERIVRINPTEYRLFLRENFDEQYRILKYLETNSDVPVPSILFYEPDTSILGAAFWVMEKVEGQVPPDNPWYNIAGFLVDASEQERRRLWLSGLETMARLARLDPASLPPVVTLAPGQSGMDENLHHWTESMNWACEGKPSDLLARTNAWLWANKPRREETGLSWGDARIGNMIFEDWRCVAVLDWETVTLAGPQLDLAHWLVMDDFASECVGATRLTGLGDRQETIRRWEQLTGLRADAIDWHEVLALFRLSIIMVRIEKLWATTGRTDLSDEQGDTLMSRQLRKVLARIGGI